MRRVLFVCIGNTCRSPMAEAFANRYGSDVLRATSAGLSPTPAIVPPTIAAMKEKNIDVSMHVPRLYDPLKARECDLVVNLSGYDLPGAPILRSVEWDVADPYGGTPALFRKVRDELEHRVMRLILDLRKQPGSK